MDTIPYELLDIMFTHITRFKDIANFMIVNRYIYGGVPNGIIRRLSIGEQLYHVHKEIRDIRHYVNNVTHAYRSLRIIKDRFCAYIMSSKLEVVWDGVLRLLNNDKYAYFRYGTKIYESHPGVDVTYMLGLSGYDERLEIIDIIKSRNICIKFHSEICNLDMKICLESLI